MSPLIQSIGANILISLISLIGAITLFSKQTKSTTVMSVMVSLAAGVMLGASFFDLLPEAFESSTISTVLAWTLVGITVSFLLERFLLWYHHHHEDTHDIKPSAYLVLFGDTIHNLIDGFVITTAFLINPAAGIATTLAIAAHEIPQELADFSILLHAGFTKRRALLYNFITALTAIIGAIISYTLLTSFEHLIPLALAFTAGMFIYIALADLVPDLHHGNGSYMNVAQALPFVIGIVLMLGLVQALPHSREHEEPDTDTPRTEYFYDDHVN